MKDVIFPKPYRMCQNSHPSLYMLKTDSRAKCCGQNVLPMEAVWQTGNCPQPQIYWWQQWTSPDSGLDHQYHPARICTHKYIDDSSEPLLIVVWITSIIQLWSGHPNIMMTAENLYWYWSGLPLSSSSNLHTQIYWWQQWTSPDSGLDHQYHPVLIFTQKYIDDGSEPLLIEVWITSII